MFLTYFYVIQCLIVYVVTYFLCYFLIKYCVLLFFEQKKKKPKIAQSRFEGGPPVKQNPTRNA